MNSYLMIYGENSRRKSTSKRFGVLDNGCVLVFVANQKKLIGRI